MYTKEQMIEAFEHGRQYEYESVNYIHITAETIEDHLKTINNGK